MTHELSRGGGGGKLSAPRVRDFGDPLRLTHWGIRAGIVLAPGPRPGLQDGLNDSPLPGGLKI